VKRKFVVTLEIECDPTEIDVLDRAIGNPSSWHFSHLLSAGGVHVTANVFDSYEACCESKVDWVSVPKDERYITVFKPHHHDETCINYVPIEEDNYDEQ